VQDTLSAARNRCEIPQQRCG